MNKLFLAALAIIMSASAGAQSFGTKAGIDLASSKQKNGGDSTSGSETAFYVGIFVQIDISEQLVFQPEVMFVSIDNLSEIHIPLMANYSVSEEFSILVGPALGIFTDGPESLSSFNYGIEAGVAYDITEEFLVEARYSLGLANLVEDAPDGISNKLSGFYIGVGYKF